MILFLIGLLGFANLVNAFAHYLALRRIAALEESLSVPRGCPHPDVKNVGTFGHPEYVCTLCHQVVDA